MVKNAFKLYVFLRLTEKEKNHIFFSKVPPNTNILGQQYIVNNTMRKQWAQHIRKTHYLKIYIPYNQGILFKCIGFHSNKKDTFKLFMKKTQC